MLIHEITEENFEEENRIGIEFVTKKLVDWNESVMNNEQSWRKQLLDPTIWAYKFLKDKQNQPLKFHGFQDKIVNDKNRFVLTAASCQIGKTWAACVKALHHAIFVNNASVLIVSRSEQQAIMILDEIKWMMKRASIDFSSIIDEVENRTELHITNSDKKGTSVIRCLPPTSSVLAYPSTLTICDEIGFWEIKGMTQIEYFNRVIVSRSSNTKNWKNELGFTMGQIFCISSPNGQQGILWSLWNNPSYHQYRYNWLSDPDNTLEEYRALKISMSSFEFDAIYAAQFTSASGGFITLAEYDDAIKEEYCMAMPVTDNLYLGGDFAGEDTVSKDVDDSVLFGAVRVKWGETFKAKIVYLHQFPKRASKSEIIYPEIKRLWTDYSVAGFGYDKMGVGDNIKNGLAELGLPMNCIEAFTYSLPNKSEIYYNMQHLFEQRRVMLPPNLKLKDQLLGLRFERTPGSRCIKIHHLREGLKDDYPDSLANCLWMLMQHGGNVSVEFVAKDKKKEPIKIGRPRKAVLCTECDNNKYSSNPETGLCDDCGALDTIEGLN